MYVQNLTYRIFLYQHTINLYVYVAHLFLHRWPVRRVQWANMGDVHSQTAVYTTAVIAHEHSTINRGPTRVCGG